MSVKRLTKFLCSEEIGDDSVRILPSSESKSSILIKNATFSWDKHELPVLNNVNLDIGEGDLVAVVGQVGSGKSSLLAAMLGLTHKTTGDVAVKGSVAYVPQVRIDLENTQNRSSSIDPSICFVHFFF